VGRRAVARSDSDRSVDYTPRIEIREEISRRRRQVVRSEPRVSRRFGVAPATASARVPGTRPSAAATGGPSWYPSSDGWRNSLPGGGLRCRAWEAERKGRPNDSRPSRSWMCATGPASPSSPTCAADARVGDPSPSPQRPRCVARMARFSVRSGSPVFARSDEDPVNKRLSERARTGANIARSCHAEGRGFESHHPLLKHPDIGGFCFLFGNRSPR
jgi:hypothetical protein